MKKLLVTLLVAGIVSPAYAQSTLFSNSTTGEVGIGSTAPITSLDLSQKTDAVALPAGATTARPSTGVNGMIRYNNTGNALEGYINNNWVSFLTSTTGTSALSALTSATGTHTIDNATYAQTWTWNTLTTQNALALSSTSETTGSLLTLTNSNTSGAGNVLNVSTASTASAAAAIKATNSGVSNTGYAIYANNASATGWGIYAPGAAPNYFAGPVGIGTTSDLLPFFSPPGSLVF